MRSNLAGGLEVSEMQENVEIYLLRHPDAGEIRYVGKACDSRARLKTHIRDARRRKTPLYDWMNGFEKYPIIEVVTRVRAHEWEKAERDAIAYLRNSGVRLLNVADGGNQPIADRKKCALNGAMVARKIHDDPVKKAQWRARHAFACFLRTQR
jgi:hypothetical protein